MSPKENRLHPLFDHLKTIESIHTSGIVVCIVNLQQLPEALVQYLNLSSTEKAKFDVKKLTDLLEQVQIWLIQESSPKPNECIQLETGLITPIFETCRWGESLLTTVASSVMEEFPFTDETDANQSKIVYIPGSSYLKNIVLPLPSEDDSTKYFRADYFMIGHLGTVADRPPLDLEVSTVGWQSIHDYLGDDSLHRRLGGKELVIRTRHHLLNFLETFLVAGQEYTHPISELKSMQAHRGSADFKRPFFPTPAEATESSRASKSSQ